MGENLGGNKGAIRIPSLSFQYLRRSGCAAKLLYFPTAGGFESHPLRHFCKSLIFLPLNFMVSVLVADLWGCERKRRTYSHVKLCLRSLCLRDFWSKHRETVVTRIVVVERAALSPTQ
jgi:hypothetical protein